MGQSIPFGVDRGVQKDVFTFRREPVIGSEFDLHFAAFHIGGKRHPRSGGGELVAFKMEQRVFLRIALRRRNLKIERLLNRFSLITGRLQGQPARARRKFAEILPRLEHDSAHRRIGLTHGKAAVLAEADRFQIRLGGVELLRLGGGRNLPAPQLFAVDEKRYGRAFFQGK